MIELDEEITPAARYLLKHWPHVLQGWSFTKTAGRIHALLLAHPNAMSSDEIMADLDISRGGVSTQLKILKDAGLVDRLKIMGESHDKFTAIRDPGSIHAALALHLRNQTVGPLQDMKNTLTAISGKTDLHWLATVNGLGNLSE
mgnify:FL=1|jgi:DNA-binding transcriptional regulator GbsR (MarR family)